MEVSMQDNCTWSGEMAQQLSTPTAPEKDSGSIPNIPTTTYLLWNENGSLSQCLRGKQSRAGPRLHEKPESRPVPESRCSCLWSWLMMAEGPDPPALEASPLPVCEGFQGHVPAARRQLDSPAAALSRRPGSPPIISSPACLENSSTETAECREIS